jgi:hypothetical protein
MENEVLNSKLARIKLYSKLSKLKKLTGTTVQSLLFPKGKFTVDKAKEWATSHGFKAEKTDVTDEFIRLRQKDPGKFNIFRTILFPESGGIKAIIAKYSASRFTGHLSIAGV